MRWHPVDAEHSFPAGAQLFTDGSCFEGRDPRTATAGFAVVWLEHSQVKNCLLYTSPSPRDSTSS
eukprot:1219438-Prorocentrum_lima.AAC.1